MTVFASRVARLCDPAICASLGIMSSTVAGIREKLRGKLLIGEPLDLATGRRAGGEAPSVLSWPRSKGARGLDPQPMPVDEELFVLGR
jgi:hypothetical protein